MKSVTAKVVWAKAPGEYRAVHRVSMKNPEKGEAEFAFYTGHYAARGWKVKTWEVWEESEKMAA